MRTWIVLLTIDALPDPERATALAKDLPDYAELFIGTTTGRTGIAFKIRARTLIKAHTRAMYAMTDLYPYFGNTPVSTSQAYDEQAWKEIDKVLGTEPLNTLLFGPPQRTPSRAAVEIELLPHSPEEP